MLKIFHPSSCLTRIKKTSTQQEDYLLHLRKNHRIPILWLRRKDRPEMVYVDLLMSHCATLLHREPEALTSPSRIKLMSNSPSRLLKSLGNFSTLEDVWMRGIHADILLCPA
jgi:hypothetical protein